MRQVGDKEEEGNTLSNIGATYIDLGQYQKAMDYYKQALRITRGVGDKKVEATILNNISGIYFRLKQKKQTLHYLKQSLSIEKEIGNKRGAAITLNNIGMLYYSLSQNQQALDYYKKSLKIRKELGDRQGEATTLNNIGGIYNSSGEKQTAIGYYQKALQIWRALLDQEGEAVALNNIGMLYSDLGQNQLALDYFHKALPIRRAIDDRNGEAITLNNIGRIYFELGHNKKALIYFQQSLPISREFKNRSVEAITLNNIGMVYYSLSQNQRALDFLKQALPIRREIIDRAGEATTLNNIGLLYSSLGQNQLALDYFHKALPIIRTVEYMAGEAGTQKNLSKIWSILDNNNLSIFYGKQAVNTLQNIRENIDNLDIKTKLKYLQSEEDTYRLTATKLIISGRLGEAQQVLDILKDEEYFSFVRKDRSAYTPQYSPIDYTVTEQKWINQQNNLVEKMSSINIPYHELLIKKAKTPGEEKKLEELKRELDKVQKEYSDFFDQMKKEFENYKYKEGPDIDAIRKKTVALKGFLKSLNHNNNEKNAILHFLAYKGQISVIVTTPTSQTVIQSPTFDEKEFNKMIYDYRDGIEKLAQLSNNSTSSSTAASKIDALSRQKRDIENKLYNLIFQPVHQYLKQYGAVNLLVSLDGVLRYIPLGTLFDGQHYLVQQCRIVRFNPSSLKYIDEKPVIGNKILGMGASKGGKGFKPLPHAGQEIRAIVHDREKGCTGLINGNALIDNYFTKETMINRLKTASYPLVHIASHFKFSPGNETNNQLLLGDGTTMSLSDIRKEGKIFHGVNLLVLSACQTGMGENGEEIDGFGRLARQCGADSVIASLWSVDDESTKELMVKFYRLLKEGKISSKIEALRLAQLELAGLEDLINKSKADAPAASAGKKDYSNPYYWAPFIMMGNGR
jgi:CHAT domain-containing protein/Tfp pilus assembly protein PilF